MFLNRAELDDFARFLSEGLGAIVERRSLASQDADVTGGTNRHITARNSIAQYDNLYLCAKFGPLSRLIVVESPHHNQLEIQCNDRIYATIVYTGWECLRNEFRSEPVLKCSAQR